MSDSFSFTYRLSESGRQPAKSAPEGADSGRLHSAPALTYVDLFATRIWQVHLDALAPHFGRWAATVLAMRAQSPQPAGRTNRQGWNSEDMLVLERPDFAPLREVVRAACAAVLAEMGQAEQAFALQSWVNLHDRGGFNFLHQHEASLLSGSFYLQVPPGSGDFVFRDPRPGVIHGSVKGAFVNGHCDVHLTPSTGLLVLFPAWAEHYVELHDSDTPRMTIAFNANVVHGPR